MAGKEIPKILGTPTALIILDGWGNRPSQEGNAVRLAATPCFDRLLKEYPHTSLGTSGKDVGLPAGQMGNSEVGHMNLGAGRIVMQDLLRINQAVDSGEFLENPVLAKEFRKTAGGPSSTLHLMGLVSDGGIHSHLNHLIALIKLAKTCGIKNCYVHAFTDGRDTLPQCAKTYIQKLENTFEELSYGRLLTLSGRFYAMDRDRRWDRVQKAYEAFVLGQGHRASSGLDAIEEAYARGETDEFIEPTVIMGPNGEPATVIKDGHGIFYFNFRPDRCRQMISVLSAADSKDFSPGVFRPLNLISISTLTRYHETYPFPVAYPPQDLSYPFGQVLCEMNLPQIRAAETEKFPHVTFFFNCRRDKPFAGEKRILINSPRDVKTYDEKPEMSAPEVTQAVIEELRKATHPFMLLNFANPDMVGHTGDLKAAIKAVETVDSCLDRVLRCLLAQGGRALVTADHGNCEEMVQPDGSPHTAHTTNRVPLILVDPARQKGTLKENGILADVVPTLMALMGLDKDPEVLEKTAGLITGKSLIN